METDAFRAEVTIKFNDVYRKINYILTKTQDKNFGQEVDLSEIEKQIQEIFRLLDALDLTNVEKRLDATEKKLSTLEKQVEINSKNVELILSLIKDWDDQGLTKLLLYVNNNKEELAGLINLYNKLITSGYTYDTFEFYAENVNKVKDVLNVYNTLEESGISVTELVSQLNFMKSYMEIEEIKNAYYDLVNTISSIVPPNLLEFQYDQFGSFKTEYQNLPARSDDIKDLTAITNSCIQLELHRNIILNSNDSTIYNEKSKTVTIKIVRINRQLEYTISVQDGLSYIHTIPEFEVTNSNAISYIPNFSNHLLFFERQPLTNTFKISILTGQMDLKSKVITTRLIQFPTAMSNDDYVSLINDLPQFATAFISYQNMISTNEFTFFKNIYVSAVLMNVVYQTELEFSEQYTNQVINNLYGQSTAIALSKAMKEIGATTRIRDVEYKLEQSTFTKYGAYIDEVTSFISDPKPVRVGIGTTICYNNVTHITDYFTRANLAMKTLNEINGRFYTNSSKTVYYNTIEKIPIIQAFEDESFKAECWLEEEWVEPQVEFVGDVESVVIDGKDKTLNVLQSVGVGLNRGSDADKDKYVVAALQVAVDTVEQGDFGEKIPDESYWGVQQNYTVKVYSRIVLYIKTNNLSGDSTNSITGVVSLNGVSYDVELFPYVYDNGTNIMRVYRGVVNTFPQDTKKLITFGGFEFKQNTSKRTVRINSFYDAPGQYSSDDTHFFTLPIYTPGGVKDIEPSPMVVVKEPNNNPVSGTAPVSISPSMYNVEGFGSLTEYGAVPQVLAEQMVYEKNVMTSYYIDKKYQSSKNYAQGYFGNNYAKLIGTGEFDSLTVPILKYTIWPGTSTKHWKNDTYTCDSYSLVGQVVLTPSVFRGSTQTTPITINSIFLKGQEITTPVQFNQLTIPDYILKMQYDIAYLNAYAEYLTALIDQLDKRVTLVEETLDQVVETVNSIVMSLNSQSRSIGGQILGFLGTSIGMFFPLIGLSISVIGQIYEGAVELKKGNLLVGVMDITTGALMSVLGVRKYRQRMERKYGAVEMKSDPGLPTYDELFGPPGYGAANVRPNSYVGRPSESPQIKGGTLRNTMILNDKPGQFMMLTWLYRTTYGYQSEVRGNDDTIKVRMLRVRERWANSVSTLTYDYMQLEQTDKGIVTTNATQSQFAADFNTTLNIQTFGKLLFAKTRQSILQAEGTGFDAEVFETFALATVPLNSSVTFRNGVFPICHKQYKIVHDGIFSRSNTDVLEPQQDLSINDLYKGLDANISNEDSQVKIFNSVSRLLTF